jgi:hypothetical protein
VIILDVSKIAKVFEYGKLFENVSFCLNEVESIGGDILWKNFI